MQSVRIIEIPKCKMISSGTGMFGDEKFKKFEKFLTDAPASMYPRDFLFWNGTGFCWLYIYDKSLDVPEGLDIIDFEGGLYSVATDIDRQTDVNAMREEVDSFLRQNGFVQDESRSELGNIITSPAAREILGYEQMDYYTPIKAKKPIKKSSKK